MLKINYMRRVLILPVLLIGLFANAQRYLSVEEAVSIALQNNYDLRLAKNDSAAAAIDYAYRNSALLPKLNGNTGIVFNNNDQYQKFSDGTIRQRKGIESSNFSNSISLNWTIFNGFKLYATKEKLSELLKMGELGIKQSVGNTVANVINTYYAIVQQKQQLKAIEEQLVISQERVKLATNKLDIGVGTKPDLLQSKVDLNAQKAAQLEGITAIRQLKEQLSQLLNSELNNAFEVSEEIPFTSRLQLNEIKTDLEKTNPELLIAQKNISIANLTLKEKKADRFPVIGINSSYNYSKIDNKAVVNPFSPLFSRNNGFNYGITATIPILNNLTVKRNIQQANLSVQNSRLIFDAQKSLLNLSIVKAYNEYEYQLQALKLEEENIALAKENVSIILEVYRLNSTTLIQLKEAQKSLQDAYTRLIRARYNTKLAETELLRLKGTLL